jgi:hypothetical protein
LLLGLLAFLAVYALAFTVAFIDLAVAHRAGQLGAAFSLAAVYLASFVHGSVRVSVSVAKLMGSSTGGLIPTLEATLRVALLLGTGLAVWLSFRAGKGGARGSAPATAALGASVPAVAFALCCLAAVGMWGTFREGALTISIGAASVFLGGLVIAAVASLIGALSHIAAARARSLLRAGWETFVWALIFAFAGLVVASTISPSAARIAFPGVDRVSRPGGPAYLANNVLALPNEAVWALVPAMGGCDGFYGSHLNKDVLCFGHLPEAGSGSTILGISLPRSGSMHWAYYLFLLAPAAATFAGGRIASAGATSRVSGAASGVVAGVVFAALVSAAAWLSSVGITLGAGGVAALTIDGAFGPKFPGAALLALAWGVAGGALGGASRAPSVTGEASPAAQVQEDIDGGDREPDE